MRVAYIDTSALVAAAFDQPGAKSVAPILDGVDGKVAANLLEAEARAACARERRPYDEGILSNIDWVYPARPLSSEMAAVLDKGYLKGADLWHVAVALYVAGRIRQIEFVTLDVRQAAVATALGFKVLPDSTSLEQRVHQSRPSYG